MVKEVDNILNYKKALSFNKIFLDTVVKGWKFDWWNCINIAFLLQITDSIDISFTFISNTKWLILSKDKYSRFYYYSISYSKYQIA